MDYADFRGKYVRFIGVLIEIGKPELSDFDYLGT